MKFWESKELVVNDKKIQMRSLSKALNYILDLTCVRLGWEKIGKITDNLDFIGNG